MQILNKIHLNSSITLVPSNPSSLCDPFIVLSKDQTGLILQTLENWG